MLDCEEHDSHFYPLNVIAITFASGDVHMPRAKTDHDPDNPTTESSNGSVSKMAAVRQALANLGYEAKPPAIDEFIQSHFQLMIPHNMISSYKSQLKATAKKSGGARRGRPP